MYASEEMLIANTNADYFASFVRLVEQASNIISDMATSSPISHVKIFDREPICGNNRATPFPFSEKTHCHSGR